MLEQNGVDQLCKTFVSSSYISQGVQELQSCTKEVKDLLSRRCMPKDGWSDGMIERLLSVRRVLSERLDSSCGAADPTERCKDALSLHSFYVASIRMFPATSSASSLQPDTALLLTFSYHKHAHEAHQQAHQEPCSRTRCQNRKEYIESRIKSWIVML